MVHNTTDHMAEYLSQSAMALLWSVLNHRRFLVELPTSADEYTAGIKSTLQEHGRLQHFATLLDKTINWGHSRGIHALPVPEKHRKGVVNKPSNVYAVYPLLMRIQATRSSMKSVFTGTTATVWISPSLKHTRIHKLPLLYSILQCI